MELVDPKQFIITRKRKKYKFALFHNSQFCFEYEQWQNLHTHNAVNLQGQILQWWDANVVEVGAGNGRFAVELAARHPNQKLVALDVKGDRLQQGARIAEERGLENIRFVRARADQICELFAPNSLIGGKDALDLAVHHQHLVRFIAARAQRRTVRRKQGCVGNCEHRQPERLGVLATELEDVVAQMPGVMECACVGVIDAKSGEAVKLVIVRKNPAITEADVRAYCEANLTGYKRRSESVV